MHQIDGSGRFTSLVGVALLAFTVHVAGLTPSTTQPEAAPITTTWVDAPAPLRARAAKQVSVQTPPRVLVGTRFRVRVQLPTAVRRPVQLQERGAGGWKVVATARTSKKGRATLSGNAGVKPGHRTFRVRAPKARPWPALTSVKQVVEVQEPMLGEPPVDEPTSPGPTPDPDPTEDLFDAVEPLAAGAGLLGSLTDWRWLHDGATGRWDPCLVIRWRYNPAGGYAGSLADVSRAFARVAGATGLRFKYVGTTELVPASGVRAPDADVVVGWAGTEVAAFQRGAVGLGGNTMYPISGRDVAYEVAHGFILFNRTARLPLGFAASGNPTWGQAMTHEVLHVVGLGHAQGAEQLMAPTVSWRNHLMGAGDLAGAIRLGAVRGCL